MLDRPVDNWSLSKIMSNKSHAVSGDVARDRRRPNSTENRCEAHLNPLKLTHQMWNVQIMLGMWMSILVVFVGRKLFNPIERNRQAFYKRFLWAAFMVCLSNAVREVK